MRAPGDQVASVPMIRWADTASHGSRPAATGRSGEWKRVRREHLRSFPTCAACGRGSNLTVHHVIPYTVDPSRELDPTNLLTLCRGWRSTGGCHLKHGHRGSWSSWNPHAISDAREALRSISEKRTLGSNTPHDARSGATGVHRPNSLVDHTHDTASGSVAGDP